VITPDKHDREIAAIRLLLKSGMRLLVKNQQQLLENERQLNALASAQRRAEQSLQAFVNSMRKGSNGHGKPA